MLSLAPQIRIILSEQDVARLTAGLVALTNQGAGVVADGLAKIAVDTLRGLEEGIGHEYLAGKWTFRAEPAVFGAAERLVYSEAESETFQNTDSHGKPSGRWTIKGEDLLRILEAGARPHEIRPTQAKRLAFLSTEGVSRSRFLEPKSKFLFNADSPAYSASLWGDAGSDMIVTRFVSHPGVVGNQFMAYTRQMLEATMAERARELWSRTMTWRER